MSVSQATPVKGPRDERLDLFRGITMLIIFLAHMPGNSWNEYIPARFGFSSGTELFVFCSGLASALAFGGVFVRRGLWLGTARIALRIWQVYWAHIGLVLALIALAALLDQWLGLSLVSEQFAPLTQEPARAILSLASLKWLPDFLDILPMYLVILALVPVVMGLRLAHPALPFLLFALLYTFVWTLGLNLPGNPWTGAGWYLNPFAWQLVFFLGFSFGMKWIRAPRLRDPRVMSACIVFLCLAVPVSFSGFTDTWPALARLQQMLLPGSEKSNLHILRVVHFLALAYVVLSVIEPWRTQLDQGLGHLLILIGRQSLGTFLASLVLARIGGVVADFYGRSELAIMFINFTAFALLLALAIGLGWIKSAPWSRARQVPETALSSSRPAQRHGATQVFK
jgi:hypothetical protein